MTKLTGGCSCGELHYESNEAVRGVAACHCIACKKRTGTAFGVGCAFMAADVEVTGEYKEYTRKSDADRSVTHRFCPNCGTTVMWVAEAFPGGLMIAGGTFDDLSVVTPKVHAWTQSKLDWMALPDGVPSFPRGPQK